MKKNIYNYHKPFGGKELRVRQVIALLLCSVLLSSLTLTCTSAKDIEREKVAKFWEVLGEKLADFSKTTKEVDTIMTDVSTEKITSKEGAKKIRDKAKEYSRKIEEIKNLKAPTSSTAEIQSDIVVVLKKILKKVINLGAEGLEKKDASLINKANANLKEVNKDIEKLNEKVGKELEKYKE